MEIAPQEEERSVWIAQREMTKGEIKEVDSRRKQAEATRHSSAGGTPRGAGLSRGVSFDCMEYPVCGGLWEFSTGQVFREERFSLGWRMPQPEKHREREVCQ